MTEKRTVLTYLSNMSVDKPFYTTDIPYEGNPVNINTTLDDANCVKHHKRGGGRSKPDTWTRTFAPSAEDRSGCKDCKNISNCPIFERADADSWPLRL